MKRTLFLLLTLLTLSLYFPFTISPILADGMVIPPPDYWVYQSDQQAVIYCEGNTETLILSVKFRGDAKEFAWIIPTPSRPQVEKAREDLFENLAKLTRERVVRPLPYGVGVLEAPAKEAEVVVWETKRIDIYEISVLSSTDAEALRKWLNEHGYQYPEGYEYILDEYIAERWFFTAVKVDTAVEPSVAEQKLRTGHAAPLRLTFTTATPIYPLKISAVTTTPEVKVKEENLEEEMIIPEKAWSFQTLSVTLYVFSNQKTQASGFDTQYAGWLLPKTISNLSVDVQGKPWVEPKTKMYLTKLDRTFTISQINEDVVLIPAEGDNPVGGGKRFVMEPWKIWALVLTPLVLELTILGIWSLKEIKKLSEK